MKEEAMPVTVTKEIKVSELHKSDVVPGGDGANRVIIDIVKKQAWAFVTFNDADVKSNDDGDLKTRAVRMRMTDPVTVLREEPTDEEKLASREAYARATFADELQGMLDRTPLKMLESIMEKAVAQGNTYDVLTSWNLPDVLKAQATYKQALRIRSYLNRDGDVVAVANATLDELVTAYAAWWYDNVDRNGIDANIDPTSRSTSVLSNLLEDIDVWAIRHIVSKFRWSGLRDRIDARLEEIKEMVKNR